MVLMVLMVEMGYREMKKSATFVWKLRIFSFSFDFEFDGLLDVFCDVFLDDVSDCLLDFG